MTQARIINTLTEKVNVENISAAKLAQLFSVSAAHNELDVVKEYLKSFPHLLHANKYDAIRLAAENGAFEVLQYLLNQTSKSQIEEALSSKDYYAFCLAAGGGHVENVKLLWNSTNNDELKKSMFIAKDYFPFGAALRSDHPQVLKFLWSIANDSQRSIIVEKVSKHDPRWSLHKLNSPQEVRDIIALMQAHSPENTAIKSLAQYYKVNQISNLSITTTLNNQLAPAQENIAASDVKVMSNQM